MPRVHLLRVFCGEGDSAGNTLAVFLEGSQIPPDARQGVAAELGLSETVFVDNAVRGEIRIFTPAVELDFAGHPAVGTAWLLAEQGSPASLLRVPAGEAPVRYEDDAAYVAGRADWGPRWEFEQLDSPSDVDELGGPPGGHDLAVGWAWLDEGAGIVRARVFPMGVGIAEDEATGSAAVGLCARLGQPLDIRQGRGSRIVARPLPDGWVEIGGRCVLDSVEEHALG